MRRTYKSKKETCDALDPKEIIFAGDEKTSAFDAFYIKNIKQTRRELSCYGSTNQQYLSIKKTRKRKFVKRIIKELDIEDSFSNEPRSTCLTPDKSIHVNKTPDPFDLLLNSSYSPKCKEYSFDKLIANVEQNLSSTPESPSKHEIENINHSTTSEEENKKRVRAKKKQYRSHKKPLKPIQTSKSHCHATISISGDNRAPINETNINDFDLIVEQYPIEDANKENSIKNIILDKSLIQKLNFNNTTNKYLGTPKNKFKNNRLTVNAIAHKSGSPLTSTPFLKRYNNGSIYKYSPIKIDLDDDVANQNDAVHQVTERVVTDIRDDINNMTKFNEKRCTLKNQSSNFQSPKESLTSYNFDRHCENFKQIKDLNEQSLITHSCVGYKQNEDAKPELAGIPDENETNISDNLSINDTTNVLSSDQEAIVDDNAISYVSNRNKTPIEINSPIICSSKNITESNNSLIEIPFLGFSIKSNKSIILQKSTDVTNSSLELFDAAKSPICSQYIPFREFSKLAAISNLNTSEDLFNSIGEESNSLVSETSKKDIDESFTSDGGNCSMSDQFYDACSVNSTYIKEQCIKNQPVIQVERIQITDDMFDEIHSESSDSSNIDSVTVDISNNSIKTDNINISYSDITTEHNLTNISDDKEDRCISFVTTRRRNEITNNSVMFLLNNSDFSYEDANYTVNVEPKASPETHFKVIEEVDIMDESSSKTLNEGKRIKNCDNDFSVKGLSEPKPLNINIIANQSLDEESADEEKDMVEPINTKVSEICRPSIVLQPGKKWERSLSIYRRMTINDNFDTSMLDEEHLSAKGRKYRQSVINTMELQDHRGPVYNDLQIQRKSSIIPKSYRPSVKLAKQPNSSRLSICSTKYDDLSEFLSEDCDETLVELSKLSLADSDHEVTVLEKTQPTRNFTARDYVLRRCNQTDAVLFDECYPDRLLKNCHKIGEGVYGEVFLWRSGDGGVRVLKVVPIAGSIRVNGEQQKDFHEIISEIVIAMELSALRAPIADINRHFDEGKDIHALDLDSIQNATDAFNEVLAVKCVFGSYPSRLLDLWDLYDECKGSENDNPAILPPDQQYIVLELANAGQDLESYQFNSAEQAYALFIQVAFALAVGEEAFQFEHRDLHWGNVLISPTEQKFGTFVLRGSAHRVPRCGVRATIIDYSLSRLSLPLGSDEHTEDSAALYNDLAQDDGLFDAVGDYQFQVYRLMRDKLGNDWKNFEPSTNILWLHYTVDKMITALRYKRTNTKIHKQYIAKLKGLKNRILNYDSAVQFVLTDNEY